ncbi:hypothetical protein AMAG_05688 [Allomyces macrogynus ATCC 38327]|uniref:Centrosomal protein of 70 kDa n=1 Tax=Allomyces macrogynus (strain ATCC 38327) TaxID=578462 RepID=A0A0L0SCK4_ALLM3|nr:hypothetical protein AMAG_05688 [Allomyces macrogynus ATCC 38327]|eukprot:KNE60278.1 hypothetical protein AMAG_05688 [Allomyces macrogynus ATCC 38327]
MAPPTTNASMFSPGGDGDVTDSVFSTPRPLLENTAIHTADAVKYLLHGPAPGGAEPSIDYAALRLALDREEVEYRSYGTRSPSPKTPDHLKSQRAPRPAWAVEEEERQRRDQQTRSEQPHLQQLPSTPVAARQPSPLRPAALRNFPDIPADTPSRSPSPPAPSFLNRTDGPFASYRPPPPPRASAPPAVEDISTSAARSSPIMPELRRAANRAARDRARSTSARGNEDLSSHPSSVLPEVPYPVSRKRAHRTATAAAAGRGRTVTADSAVSSEASGSPSITSVPSSMPRSASSVTTPSSSSYTTSSRSSRPHHHRASAAAVARSRALRELSEFMQATGLPPLPPNVVDVKLPEVVQVSLDHAIPHVMNEFNRRGDLIRELVQRLSKEEEEEIARRRVRDAIKAAGGGDTTQIDRILAAQKGGSKNHVEDLRIKYEQVRAQAERDAAEAQALRDELQTVTTKSAAQQRRAEQSFQTVAAQFRKPGHGALDQVTTEVVDVYERKVDGLQQEIKNLRDQVRRMTRAEGHSPAPPMLDEVPAPPDQFLRLKHTLEQQIGLLQKKIDEQQKVIHRRAERDQPHAPPAPPTGGSTRDRIRRDKLHFQLKLYEIDAMPAEQCRDVLKDVCIRLHVKGVHAVVNALEEVAKVVHMVPKMQQYIRQVDELVWRRPLVDPADKNGNRKPSNAKKAADPQGIHAVRDTFRVLQFWAQELEVLDHARTYRTRLFQLLGVDPDRLPGETPDEDAELMAVEEIKRLLAFEKNTHRRETRQLAVATGEGTSPEATYARVVSHFCNLFEVSTLADAFPKLNELFVFTAEVENGLRRLRDVLGVGEGVPVTPAAVLNRAADELLVRVAGASFRVEDAEDMRDLDRVPVTFATAEPNSRPPTGTLPAPSRSPVAASASAAASFMRSTAADRGRGNGPNDVLRDLEQLLDRVSHEEAELMDEDADLELPSFLRRSPDPTRRGFDDDNNDDDSLQKAGV